MIPVIIEDLIKKILDKNTHIEKRQFYYATLSTIHDKVSKALKEYEKEKGIK